MGDTITPAQVAAERVEEARDNAIQAMEAAERSLAAAAGVAAQHARLTDAATMQESLTLLRRAIETA